ncbi:E3 ubiquitin-protein ligase HECTD1 [Hypsibius exemplaris]|uniref:E3 ubiquitin-protein ligase n=1 Tax=Hypsibius exemplaris TaxID=2072580 RepID=A0A1W0WIN1_HYPEX|nr:E3 ubiquitin-protein ligase HECTD1 [Hypsibius exemplaris]
MSLAHFLQDPQLRALETEVPQVFDHSGLRTLSLTSPAAKQWGNCCPVPAMAGLGGEVDPETLLEWLSTGQDEQRDMQAMALEHLCMALLMSDNVDRCFEMYPPKTFIPPLCTIFLDVSAPDSILEVTARALTYYLDVSQECTRRILSVDGTVRAICNRLLVASLDTQTGRDLAEQCIKVLEHMSSREFSGLVEAGALNAVLTFIQSYGTSLHKDALRSAMGVVSRLCTKIEPSDASVSNIIESLTALLKHNDSQVCESAMRCFTALADRFSRREGDPDILNANGLTEVLLSRLINVPKSSRASLVNRSSTSAADSNSTTAVLNLLQILVRGSPSVSKDLCLSPDLHKAILTILDGNDRNVMEVTRLVESLLTVLFEGRQALPRPTSASSSLGRYALRRLDGSSATDRSNRHLIEVIRGRDFDGLVEAVENTAVDVNLVDDVGQSLLNWASAFGTQEMVEFLLESGADPDKGSRSSSLHYSACFGRLGIAKVLLQYGADQNLKDEDGKTALERARERNEEGHREIVKLLTTPQVWTPPPRKFKTKDRTPQARDEKDAKGENPEIGVGLVVRLLSIFTQSGVGTLNTHIRRSCAGLVKRMLSVISGEALVTAMTLDQDSRSDFRVSIVKLISMLLGSDDEENVVVGLEIADLLATKCRDAFLDNLFRAGVVGQIAEKAVEDRPRTPTGTAEPAMKINLDDIAIQKFGDWNLMKTLDSVCLWTDFMILELPNSSSGWFQTCINGKVSVFRSDSGRERISESEGVTDASGMPHLEEPNKGDLLEIFLNLLQSLRNEDNVRFSILTASEPTRFGNWIFTCLEARVLRITNMEGNCEIQVRHNLTDTVVVNRPGESPKSLIALSKVTLPNGQEANLSPDKLKSNTGRKKVRKLAADLFARHFENAHPTPRGPQGILMPIANRISQAVQKQAQQDIKHLREEKSWSDDFRSALRDFVVAIRAGESISPYEVQSANLVRILNSVFGSSSAVAGGKDTLRAQRVEIWKSVFHHAEIAARPGRSPSEMLIRLLVAVLECAEKLPVVAPDNTGPGNGFQVLSRPVTVRIEMKGDSNRLMDRTGRKMRIEPLVTIRELDDYLWKKLFKNWYDFERSQLEFVRRVKELGANCRIPCPYTADFDEHGVLHWIGTNGRTSSEWVNPATTGLVAVQTSDGTSLPCGSVSDLLNRSALPAYLRTSEARESWFAVDLGVWLEPTHYTLRHGRGTGALRSWLFQASRDATSWHTLRSHVEDASLLASGSTATWRLEANGGLADGKAWRYYRVQLTGENAEMEHCICASGFELHGTVVGVCDEVGKAFLERPAKRLRQGRLGSDSRVEVKSRVTRGRDWVWGSQDGIPPTVGTVVARHADDWVDVIWDSGEGQMYRMGADGKYDLSVLSMRSFSAASHLASPFSRSVSSPAAVLASGAGISRANKLTTLLSADHHHHATVAPPQVYTSTMAARVARPAPSRVSSSTLSLPETSDGRHVQLMSSGVEAGNPGVMTEQTVSAEQLDRPVETLLSGGITRAEPTSHLDSFGGLNLSNRYWRLASVTHQEMPEDSSTRSESSQSPEANEDSSSELADSRMQTPADADIRLSRMQSNNQSDGASDHSTPVGSSLSLNDDSAEYHIPALNQFSVSVPNLSSPSTSQSGEEGRQNPLRLMSRASRAIFAAVSNSRAETLLEDADLSGALSTAQSFPTLSSQQECLMDPLRFAPNARTQAFLQALRSLSNENGEFSLGSSTTGLDLKEALDLTYREDESGGERGGGGFASLADFAFRALHGRSSRDSEGAEDGSSEDDMQDTSRLQVGWSNDFVLKRQFSSLVPNFDPRPGRNNVSQTVEVDITLPARGESGPAFNSNPKDESKMFLSLSGTCAMGTKPAEVYPMSPDENILSLVQRLIANSEVPAKLARSRKVWDCTFTLKYGESSYMTQSTSSSFSVDTSNVFPCCFSTDPGLISDTLSLLKTLREIAVSPKKDSDNLNLAEFPTPNFTVDPIEFHSPKVSTKLLTQLDDVVAVAAHPSTLPAWCSSVMTDYPMIIPYNTRHYAFSCTAFGPERSILWLQTQREQMLDTSRAGRMETLFHDFRLGRQKHLRVRKISRQHILDSATAVMFLYGSSKSILEVEFENEEGTGLGPTLEFYSLIAAELQRKDLAMWICDDEQEINKQEIIDLGSGAKYPGFYVRSPAGLFPAPYPHEHPALAHLKTIFRLLGLTVGRALMDNRLLDLPLSLSFLQLLCGGSTTKDSANSHAHTSPTSTEPLVVSPYGSLTDVSAGKRSRRQQRRSKKSSSLRAVNRCATPAWYDGQLGIEHLEQIDPHRGKFLRGLTSLIKKRRLITDDLMLNEEQKREKYKTLFFEFTNGDRTEHVRLDDLGLTFEFSPSSKVFKYISCDLIAEGDTVPVTILNVDNYVDLTLDFCLNSGIRLQMDAFREGLEQVMPLEKLQLFSPEELRLLLCGDQAPSWTREDLISYTEPKLGYSSESPAFQRLVNVLCALTATERKAFVHFITGSSSLPPGGLANLHPRLTVVKKLTRDQDEGYPSVNTCVHFLKLPEYSSEDVLYQRLMAATRERGFHFN